MVKCNINCCITQVALLSPDSRASYRVRKSKNFPDSKSFTAKTFRIKRVNRDIGYFATKVHKSFMIKPKFFQNIVAKLLQTYLLRQKLHDTVELRHIVRTVSNFSGLWLHCPNSLQIVQTVFELSSFQIIQAVSRLSGKFLDCPKSFQPCLGQI